MEPAAEVAGQQLGEQARHTDESATMTLANGAPAESFSASLTAGPYGDLSLQDTSLFDALFALDHERIPPRVVHAKGSGAFGNFEVTSPDIQKYCKAQLFQEVGKQTPLVIRFSQVAGEAGSPDTVRDVRGFAIKFYTEDGNWDLVGNNTPIFWVRDPILFPSFVHSQKRNPVTNLRDPNAFWDFLSLRPESIHQTLFTFSDRGIVESYRFMEGFGSHTFKTVNADGEAFYVKWHWQPVGGVRTLPLEDATRLCGTNPDYYAQDLYEAIKEGNFPVWTLYFQVMTFQQAVELPYNPFDLTKVWFHGDFPLIEIGRITLDRNPHNYFAEIEQLAFNVSSLVPGIQASPDKMMQARMFSYPDTQHHRLGSNYMKIPVNSPFRSTVNTYRRDGLMCVDDNGAGQPNYFPNSYMGPIPSSAAASVSHSDVSAPGEPRRYESGDEDNFSQPRIFFTRVLDEQGQQTLAKNIAIFLGQADDFIQQRCLNNFYSVDQKLGDMVKMNLQQEKQSSAEPDSDKSAKMPSPATVAEPFSPNKTGTNQEQLVA